MSQGLLPANGDLTNGEIVGDAVMGEWEIVGYNGI